MPRLLDPLLNLVPKLLHVGLLHAGTLLSAIPKPDLQAEVLADGKLLLNAWPKPMSLRSVTEKAHEIAVWGAVPFIPKLRRQDPLRHWSFHDQYTNRDEKLARFHELLESSHVETGVYCAACSDAIGPGDAIGPQSDAFAFCIVGSHRLAIAPRRHFTNLKRMPARDTKAVNALLQAEIAMALREATQIDIRDDSNSTGHAYYSIGLPK